MPSYTVTKLISATEEKVCVKVKFNQNTKEEYYEVDMTHRSGDEDANAYVDRILTGVAERALQQQTPVEATVEGGKLNIVLPEPEQQAL